MTAAGIVAWTCATCDHTGRERISTLAERALDLQVACKHPHLVNGLRTAHQTLGKKAA